MTYPNIVKVNPTEYRVYWNADWFDTYDNRDVAQDQLDQYHWDARRGIR